MLTTPDGPAVVDAKAIYWSKIAEYYRKVWCEETTVVWLPDREKNFEDIFTLFDRRHERYGDPDGQLFKSFRIWRSTYQKWTVIFYGPPCEQANDITSEGMQ